MIEANLLESLIDQYKVEQHVAEKQFTDVYQAYDIDDNQLVWLDIVRPELAGDSNFTNQFNSRAKAIAQVRHPNIARVFHVGKTPEGLPYTAQAYVDGLPLAQRLDQLAQRNTPVNSLYALKLVRQLADALLLAERLDLIHYDLQPENVFLKNVALPTDDAVVLIDLFIPNEKLSERPGHDVETIAAYRSPEQRSGRDLKSSSHVYSLGVLLFHLLSGHPPARPVTLQDTAAQRLFGQPTSLARARAGLATETYQIVDRSLRTDANQRYRGMDEFIVALDEAIEAEERLVGEANRPGQATTRRKWGWIVSLFLLALFVLVGFVAFRSFGAWNVAANGQTAEASPISGVGAVLDTPTLAPSPAVEEEVAGEDATSLAAIASSPTVAPTITEVSPSPEPTVTPTLSPSATPRPTDIPSPTPARLVRVAFNSVNLRRGPGVVFATQGFVSSEEDLAVIAWNGEPDNPWYLIVTENGRTGWISDTVVVPVDGVELSGIPVAATFPPTPLPTNTSTPTPTSTPIVGTVVPTISVDDNGQPQPTGNPPKPPPDPTLTPPPLP